MSVPHLEDRGKRPHVVIVGGGFGGLNVARGLRNAPVRVTLIDRTNHHLFQPLLYQVATAGLSPADIAAPIRGVLRNQKNTEVVMAEVTGVDVSGRTVIAGDLRVPYDYLICATGARHSYYGHENWSHWAHGLKSLSDATLIRREILMAFESAELEEDEARKRSLLTFVLIGAGPTGVEMAGAIAELAHRALASDFRHIDPQSARVVLLEAGPRILSAFPESLARAAERELKQLGVEVRAGGKVSDVEPGGVTVGDERIESRTVIWTAGVRASPAASWIGAEADQAGRVKVAPDLSVPGHPEIFAIGDTMTLQQNGHSLPGLAPVAMQQGSYVAAAIARRVKGGRKAGPFHYVDKGNLATVGRSFAILDEHGVRMSGFFAWVAWIAVHIFYLIGFRNRFLVLFQWAWAYFTFQRGARLILGAGMVQPAEDSAP
ncbi:MAG TPA: NAD(P)/FAD-dependent oxidoreductase, partial [Chthonomonadales bacterium]|nr:NAD(P)/FAD-dependent oxidoreductase [Chthonomonadales bacterium]